MPELSGLRPDPVLDLGPPVVGERHSGVGFEILLDVHVPQLGRDIKEQTSQELVRLILGGDGAGEEGARAVEECVPVQQQDGREEEEEKEEEEEAAQNFLLYLLPVQGEEPGCGGVRGGRGGRGVDRERTA